MSLEKKHLVSIVIPVYNVEKYLDLCIKSAINQTYKNIEIWLVDDGSTDKSGELCDYYSEKDSRIKVIHKENGGLSSARNTALKQIKGDYVFFLDSDDCIAKNVIKSYVDIITRKSVDVVIGTLYDFCDEKIISDDLNSKEYTEDIYSKVKVIEQMLLGRLPHCAQAKLFKTSFFNDIEFPEGSLYEDFATIFYVIEKANKVAICDDRKYFYRIRQGSIMTSKVTEKDMILLDIAESVTNNIKNNHKELSDVALKKCFLTYLKLYSRILYSGLNNLEKYQQRIRKYIKENVSDFMSLKCISMADRAKVILFYFGKIPFYLCYKLSDYIKLKRLEKGIG